MSESVHPPPPSSSRTLCSLVAVGELSESWLLSARNSSGRACCRRKALVRTDALTTRRQKSGRPSSALPTWLLFRETRRLAPRGDHLAPVTDRYCRRR